MIRTIETFGNELLHSRAKEVSEITESVVEIVDDMVDTMYAVSGVGLAAPQIGVPLRIFVADSSFGKEEDGLIIMINPEVVSRVGIQNETEGCLSLPDFEALVPRPAEIVVSGLSRSGELQTIKGTGLLARAFQHEVDHLDGMLFLDRLRGIKREMILRRIRKLRRDGRW